MRLDVLTLFPDMFSSVLSASILKRAADPALYATACDPPALEPAGCPVAYHLTDIRDHTTDKHGKVDDTPYGGGPGMVMRCQPVWDAVKHVESLDPRPAYRILMTPQGEPLRQPLVDKLAQLPRLLIIAGHYEGIDQRVIQRLAPLHEISIGDYVLSGGELPAMVLIDSIVRLIPGVLGDQSSTHRESFATGSHGKLDHPHYTRPAQWEGMSVPEILISGDHAKIEAWRREQELKQTQVKRPDLMGQE